MSQTPLAPRPPLLLSGSDGRMLVPVDTPLRRLNYFDGKFLRAEDLRQEQEYLRTLVAYSNRAGGPGVVHGFDVSLRGGTVTLDPGLAVDTAGRVLLLGSEAAIPLSDLLAAARQRLARPSKSGSKSAFAECEGYAAEPSGGAVQGTRLHLLTIAHAEALCGEEDVYGRLCEEACLTGTARPYRLEGVALRLRPLQLRARLKTSGRVKLLARPHLRNLVASAYFADEAEDGGSQISGAGLRGSVWCNGAEPHGGVDVPLAVLAERSGNVLFLDAWTVRRERMEPPPRAYWAGRMAMRPWNVFLAHVLQFQCQLASLLRNAVGELDEEDPCRSERDVMRDAADAIRLLKQRLERLPVLDANASAGFDALPLEPIEGEIDRILRLDRSLRDVLKRRPLLRSTRILIRGGIVELPAAGYLPIDPLSSERIESQVRRLFGEGVDLRFCAARADYVPHALEESQHMERIDLIRGLEREREKPKVDVIVPDGWLEEDAVQPDLNGYRFVIGAFSEPMIRDGMIPGWSESRKEPLSHAAGADRADASSKLETAPRIDIGGEFVGAMLGEELRADASTLLRMMQGAARPVGALRAERTGRDGGAFYFAGRESGGRFGGLRTVLQAMEKVAEEEREGGKAAEGDLVSRFVRAAGGAARRASPDLYEAARTKSGPSGTRAEPASSGAPQAQTSNAETPEYGILEPVEVVAQRWDTGVLWGMARAERDPFAARVGEPVDFELRLVAGRVAGSWEAGGVGGGAMEIRLTGRFTRVGPSLSAGNVRTVRLGVAVRAQAQWTRHDGTAISIARSFEREVLVDRLEDEVHGAVRIRIPLNAGIEVALLTYWPAAEFNMDVQFLFGLTAGSMSAYYGGVGLVRSAAIFDPANVVHQAAAGAIDALGAVLVEPGFAEREKANLFRPGSRAGGIKRVRTNRDWVFFRRRREVDCGRAEPQPAPEPPPAREPPPVREPDPPASTLVYRVYVASITPPRLKALGLDLFWSAEVISSLEPRPAGTFESAIGTPSIVPSPGFAADYAATSPGARLLAAAIGDDRAAPEELENLRLARLNELILALPPHTADEGSALRFVVDDLPDRLPRGDAAGVVLLITDFPMRPVVHEVGYLPNENGGFVERIRGAGISAIPGLGVEALEVPRLTFVAGLPLPPDQGAKLEEGWRAAVGHRPVRRLYVAARKDSMAERLREAEAILPELSPTGAPIEIEPLQIPDHGDLPPGADAVMVLQ